MYQRILGLAGCTELRGENYDFLSHDSYANCAQPIKAKLDLFMVDDLKYCGLLNEQDLAKIQQQIVSSGSLTADEIAMFF